jgi:hypothetical protein
MKKFALLAVLLSLSLSLVGCEAKKKEATPAAPPAGGEPAAPPAEAPK